MYIDFSACLSIYTPVFCNVRNALSCTELHYILVVLSPFVHGRLLYSIVYIAYSTFFKIQFLQIPFSAATFIQGDISCSKIFKQERVKALV